MRHLPATAGPKRHRSALRRGALALLCLTLALPAVALEKVSLQLKWRHQFQFAGYYMAREKGFYREQGLEVDIQEGNADTDPVAQVVSGKAQFGIGASELVLERSQGKPVVAMAAIMQHSPLVIFTRAGGEVRRIQDLEGRRLMLLPTEAEMFAYLRRSRVAVDKIKLVPHSFTPEDLISGKVDALSGYATDEGYLLEKAGIPYLAFSPRSAGIDFYGDTLFTSEQQIARHPGQVEAFRQASLRGWEYAMAHPEEAVELILRQYGNRHSREHLLFEAERLTALVQLDMVEIGHMTAGRWQRIAAAYADLDMIASDFHIDGLLYTPPPPPRMTPLAWGSIMASLALAVAAILTALHILRLHRRLQAQVRSKDEAESILRASQERLRVIYETAPLAAVVYDEKAQVLEWNHRAEEIFGWKREEVMGHSFFNYMIPAESRSHVAKIVGTIFDGPHIQYSLNTNLTKDGRTILCEWSNAIFLDEHSGQRLVIAMASDVTERERIQQALQESESRYRALLESAPFPVVITRVRDSSVVYINQRASVCFQVPQEEAPGRFAPDYWVEGGQRIKLIEELKQHQVVTDMEVNLRDGQGHPFWALLSARIMLDGDEPLAFVSFNNISERKRAEEALQELNGLLAFRLQEINILQERLQEQAIRDGLTGLFNRRYLDETLERELARAQRDGYPLAVAMIDIDRFKLLNDTYGHRAGDEMLRILGQFLQSHARSGDIPCRYGGEEFLLVLPHLDQETALQRAEEWRSSFAAQTVTFGQLQLTATLSIGIASYPGHGKTADTLVDAADGALYQAKKAGRNRVVSAREQAG